MGDDGSLVILSEAKNPNARCQDYSPDRIWLPVEARILRFAQNDNLPVIIPKILHY
jgi:hypothetical protein